MTLAILFSLKTIESFQTGVACVNERLGLVYNKHQYQRCANSTMAVVILFSLKSVESLGNRLQPQSGVTRLILMRTESQMSLQSCRSVDADAWCKWTLRYISVVDGWMWMWMWIVLSWMQLLHKPNSFAPRCFSAHLYHILSTDFSDLAM